MGDFGAGTCDFHSDFASDFRTESNDYASDFHDFTGDSDGDFNRYVRNSGSRTDGMAGPYPAAAETAPPQIDSRRRSTAVGLPQGRRQAGSASGKPRGRGQRHATRPQTRRTAHAKRREYRDSATKLKRLTAVLKWQIRHIAEKPPEYTSSKEKPRTA